MQTPQYKRILLKISGEALAGDKHFGLDFDVIGNVCDVVKQCVDMGVQVGIVTAAEISGRGVRNGTGKMERTRAESHGQAGYSDELPCCGDGAGAKGVPVRVQTAIEMRAIAEPYIRLRAVHQLEKGSVVIFGCGTGNPYFSTDTAAVLRAAEINADVIMLAKNVDGVYDSDPVQNPRREKIRSDQL